MIAGCSRTASRCNPLETEWGRKRTIDQSSCNKDFSCIKGFCPSFVTVHGAKLKKGEGVAADHDLPAVPDPKLPAIDQTYNIIVTGVGGTGIVTIGGILGMAGHLEGRGVGVLDMAGSGAEGWRGIQLHSFCCPPGRYSRHPRCRRPRRSCAGRRHRSGRHAQNPSVGQTRHHRHGGQYFGVPAG